MKGGTSGEREGSGVESSASDAGEEEERENEKDKEVTASNESERVPSREEKDGDETGEVFKVRKPLLMRRALISGRLAPLTASISDKSKKMISALAGASSIDLGKGLAPWDKSGAPLGKPRALGERGAPESASQNHK